MTDSSDISVNKNERLVGTIEITRPPHNFFDAALIRDIAVAMEDFDKDDDVRAVVLCAQGKSFCAGADFGRSSQRDVATDRVGAANHLYHEAVRLFRTKKPIVAAVHGAAIGGGLGLACAADFRVTCPEARFSANFTRLGFHPGFGLTVMLPQLVGQNQAELMLYTGRRIGGEEALRIGLANICVPQHEVRDEAIKLAAEIAEGAPLAVAATRQTMRHSLAERFKAATDHELREQHWLGQTDDFQEGILAAQARRPPRWQGR